jgi:hypothetical protein
MSAIVSRFAIASVPPAGNLLNTGGQIPPNMAGFHAPITGWFYAPADKKLKARLDQLANSDQTEKKSGRELERKRNQLASIEQQLKTAARNLALAADEAQHHAMATVFGELAAQKKELQEDIESLASRDSVHSAPTRSEVME